MASDPATFQKAKTDFGSNPGRNGIDASNITRRAITVPGFVAKIARPTPEFDLTTPTSRPSSASWAVISLGTSVMAPPNRITS